MVMKWSAVAVAIGCSACTPSFQSASQVTDLRILAMQAEPPESLFDAQCSDATNLSTCTVSNIDDMHLSILFVDPVHPHQTGAITPTLCPTNTTSPICGDGSLALEAQSGPQDTIGFSLEGALLDADLQKLPALIYASAEASALKGFGGIDVEWQASVDTGDANGAQLGHKTLVFNPRLSTGNPNRNHNPVITGMKVIAANGTDLGVLAPGQTLQLTVGAELGLRPILAPGSVETYQTVDLTGHSVTVTENLEWDFYSTTGSDFDNGTAYEPLPGVADPALGLTRMTATKIRSGTLWAVVHDGRGGTSWIELPWISGGGL
jgi:hypothetical protein